MKPDIKYLYANFLCKSVEQYINIIAPVVYTFDYDVMEDFWQSFKIISDHKPRAEWNKNRSR